MKLLSLIRHSPRGFGVVTWAITAVIVLGLGAVAAWRLHRPLEVAAPQAAPTAIPVQVPEDTEGDNAGIRIARQINLVTVIPTEENTEFKKYTVERGDSLYGVADQYHIKPETLYWANYEVFDGSPDSLAPGDELLIPPLDGVYYQWQEGDTFESVADAFGVEPDAIIDWSGNQIDLTEPSVPVGEYVMVPGGEKNDQPLFIETVSRYSTALAAACGGGYMGRGYFTWPAALHSISGFDWEDNGGSHKGIDISAPEGVPIYAADTGVVTKASVGAYNNGYGNVIQIDHGNGFVTLYAHLSAVYVSECQSVLAGAVIGASGNTGNSYGAHLHFEIRLNNAPQNPWLYLP